MASARKGDGASAGMSSVANALRILDLLDDGTVLRVVEVARHLGVASSTAHRLLRTLREQGYLRQDVGSARYLPGPAVLRLARRISTQRTLEQMAPPHLRALCRDLNETVNLQILVGGDVLFIASAEDQHSLRVATRSGTSGPAHASAGGKLLLAQLDHDDVRARLGDRPATLTSRTHGNVDQLLDELDGIRRRGHAINLGETDEGVNAVAVPVFDTDGEVLAALSLAAPAARLPMARIPTVLPFLHAASAAISAGYSGARPSQYCRSPRAAT